MPTYHVTDPSGATWEVNAPEGATEQDAIGYIQKQQSDPNIQRFQQMNSNWNANNPIKQLGNVQRGAVDVIGGGADLLARGANALGLVPKSNPGSIFAGPQDVEAQNAQARQNIDQMFGPQQPGFGSSLVRGGSAGLLSLPLTPVKYLQAPSLIGRAVGAGVGGAIASGIQDSPGGSNADFFKRKGLQAAVGFGAGALSQPIAEGVVGQVVSGLNALADKGVATARNLTGANSIDQMVNLTRNALAKSGIDYDQLNENVKQGLLSDVQNAMKSYSGTNPAAIARQAAFRQEGFDPLHPWITRDPADYTAVENLSAVPGIGGPLAQRKAQLDQLVQDRINGLRGTQLPPQQVGSSAISDLNAYLGGQQGKTNVLYGTFRDIAPDVTGNPQRFVNDVFGGLEGQMALGSLPEGIKNILNGMSMGKIPVNPSTLYQLQKMAKPGADGSVNFALGHLRSAIDREMGNIAASVGPTGSTLPVIAGAQLPDQQGAYAADVLKMARAQHAQTQSTIEGSPILKAATEGTLAPENFVPKLLGGSVDDLNATWTKLSPDTQTQIRSQVYDMLRQKAFGGATDKSGKPVAQATFNNFINDPVTSQKLETILGPDGFQTVKRLGLMVESAKMQPAGSAVNNSHTSGALMGFGGRLSKGYAGLKLWGSEPLGAFADRSIVQNAQSAPASALGARSPVINPLVEELLKRRMGQFAGLLGGASAFPATAGLLGYQTP